MKFEKINILYPYVSFAKYKGSVQLVNGFGKFFPSNTMLSLELLDI